MENIHIIVDRDVHKELMLFKLQSKVKSINEAMKIIIAKLKELGVLE